MTSAELFIISSLIENALRRLFAVCAVFVGRPHALHPSSSVTSIALSLLCTTFGGGNLLEARNYATSKDKESEVNTLMGTRFDQVRTGSH
jgi:hypothetical protein